MTPVGRRHRVPSSCSHITGRPLCWRRWRSWPPWMNPGPSWRSTTARPTAPLTRSPPAFPRLRSCVCRATTARPAATLAWPPSTRRTLPSAMTTPHGCRARWRARWMCCSGIRRWAWWRRMSWSAPRAATTPRANPWPPARCQPTACRARRCSASWPGHAWRARARLPRQAATGATSLSAEKKACSRSTWSTRAGASSTAGRWSRTTTHRRCAT